jgi:hydrogenase maturation protease
MPNPRILIACIGNIFLGDDAFGVEVAARLSQATLSEGVRAADYGIRSFDLAMALLDGYDNVIMVDAAPRGGTPGTLYVIEPDLPFAAAGGAAFPASVAVETHGMGPEKVLNLAAALGGPLPRVLVVGCEPSPMVADDSDIMAGLSPPVQAAVDEAVRLIDSLVQRLLTEATPGTKGVLPCRA